jgi:hypothetical protein
MASAILLNTLDNFFADDIKVFSIKDSEIPLECKVCFHHNIDFVLSESLQMLDSNVRLPLSFLLLFITSMFYLS